MHLCVISFGLWGISLLSVTTGNKGWWETSCMAPCALTSQCTRKLRQVFQTVGSQWAQPRCVTRVFLVVHLVRPTQRVVHTNLPITPRANPCSQASSDFGWVCRRCIVMSHFHCYLSSKIWKKWVIIEIQCSSRRIFFKRQCLFLKKKKVKSVKRLWLPSVEATSLSLVITVSKLSCAALKVEGASARLLSAFQRIYNHTCWTSHHVMQAPRPHSLEWS